MLCLSDSAHCTANATWTQLQMPCRDQPTSELEHVLNSLHRAPGTGPCLLQF